MRAPLSLERLALWLRCPNCSQDLTTTGERLVLGCESGHRFDVNKRGYASLVATRDRAAGDSAAMLDARHEWLERGHYAPIAAALRRQARPPVAYSSPQRVVDAGCGTGYYLNALLEPGGRGLAIDRSPHAVRRAMRDDDHADDGDVAVDGLVADLWQPLPIRDGSAGVVLNVFAPHNPAEFARILAPAGLALIVVPRAGHLAELRTASAMLDVPDDKAQHVAEQFEPFFRLDGVERVTFALPNIGRTGAEHLIAMGPSTHHGATVPATVPSVITADVDVLRFQREPQPRR